MSIPVPHLPRGRWWPFTRPTRSGLTEADVSLRLARRTRVERGRDVEVERLRPTGGGIAAVARRRVQRDHQVVVIDVARAVEVPHGIAWIEDQVTYVDVVRLVGLELVAIVE